MRWRPVVYVMMAVQAVLVIGFAALAFSGVISLSGSNDGAQAAERPAADRFDERRAFELLRRQVALGPRPAGSPASRSLAEELRRMLPGGRFQPVPGGLRNVIGTVPGRDPRRTVVVGAHYDTKDLPGFVGANDGASGTAVLVELARTLRPRTIRPTVVFVAFDGEESPAGTADGDFETQGLRGARTAAASLRRAEAMILLDFVGDRQLSIPRELNSDARLWSRLRAAASRVGAGRAFPAATQGPISDDHLPFLAAGVPSIDLIDFDFPCWHRTCDDLSAVSPRSLDLTGETVRELLASL
ncbi:MAG: Zn-dependent exopeptidase M28 [Thermoleophilaceae bacterium]|nr:Zn-dependent exopeptidase M28 [Thermoleophilaceae bacterium]